MQSFPCINFVVDSSTPFSPPLGSPPEPPIDGGIEDDHDCAQQYLKASCQIPRVEHRQQIVCDEVGTIRCLAILLAQPILQRRERAYPAGEFDDRAPDGSRQV
jgi:hypothetical protein